jgi:tripartite ATP-independent transporter DctM subunit
MNNGWIIVIMASLFVGLGYIGVPVVFSITAGVLVAAALTKISFGSIVGQLFHGIDAEALLAIPFFLLVGELMTAANVTHRMIALAQVLVGHLRGGLAQVVTVFSIFFAGISGSSTADVAALARTVGPEMDKEGYDRAFTAALIASAATIANLIPPSIMAVVYGATGNVSIGGLFLAGVVPGLMIGVGLMIYSFFFGPPGILRPRATLAQFSAATKAAALPLIIPLIIMGGILTGWFTPTEAGLVAVAYIVFFLIPVLNRGHIKHLARDFANVGLMYSIPLAAVAAASAFGWMLAYLRGPDVVAGWISDFAGPNALVIMLLLVALFVIVGDFVDAVPAIIIFMPILNALAELGNINPVHMGVTIITTLAFGLITPPYGITLLMSSKFVGVSFLTSVIRSLPLYVVFFATILFCVLFPEIVLWLPKHLLPESVGCFKNPSATGYICPKF